jgi:hypothetical protein
MLVHILVSISFEWMMQQRSLILFLASSTVYSDFESIGYYGTATAKLIPAW